MPLMILNKLMVLKYFVHFQAIKWQLYLNFQPDHNSEDLYTVFSWEAFTNNFESYHCFLQFDWLPATGQSPQTVPFHKISTPGN